MKHLILFTIYILSFTAGSVGAYAKGAAIEGNIKLIDSTTALPGVSVYLSKTNFNSTTNSNGNYTIKNLPPGDYTIVVSAIGYLTQKKEICVGKDMVAKHDFIMTETIYALSEVTVTGGIIGVKKISGSAFYISPKELEKYSYTDINRTLRAVPGINIQEEDGFGLFPSIGLRGTGVERNTKITVMEDGVLIAPAPYAAPAAYYFPTIGRMQGVEILKGSSQIRYGPYTTGGAINLISTQIPNNFSGKISLLGGSFGGRNLHAFVGNSHKNFSYLVETFQYGSNGFKQLDGPGNRGLDRNSGFGKQDYLAKIRVNTDDDAKVYQAVTLKFGQSTGDINETYLGLTQNDFDANPVQRYAGSQVDRITTDHTQYSLTHKAVFPALFSITTTAYRTDFKRNWYKLDRVVNNMGKITKIAGILDDPEGNKYAYDIISGTNSGPEDALLVKANNRSYYSQGAQTVLRFNLNTNYATHAVDLGLRLHQDQIDRFQWFDKYAMDNAVMELINSGIHGTESNRIETADAFAAYIQYKLIIGDLTITPGARYENITQKRIDYGKNDPDRTANDITERSNTVNVFIPGIGFDYKFNNHISAFAGLHKGFAPPGSKADLQPEISINYELGLRTEAAGLSGQATVFLNDYTNLLGTDLEAAGGGGTNEQFNGGAVKTKGLEFNLTYDLLISNYESNYRLPLSLIYTYTDAEFQNDFDSDFSGWGKVSAGDKFPYLANNQFTIMLGLEHHKFNINLSGRYIDAMRTVPGQGKIIPNEATDSYFVIDASAGYNLTMNITLFANATNLTDRIYIVARRPAGLRPGMPRAVNIGIKANF